MNLTKTEIAQRIQRFVPSCEISLGAGEDKDQRNYEVSYTRIRRLGFRSAIGLDSGIEELIAILPLMSKSEERSYKNV